MSSIQIGTLGTIPTITVGGRVFTDLTNLIILIGVLENAGDFTTLRKMNATSGYQVPGGKTFTAMAIKIAGAPQNIGCNHSVLYGDNDVGENSASAPATPVYAGGFTAPSATVQSVKDSGGALLFPEAAINFQVPTGKFMAHTADASVRSIVYIYGYEA